MFQYGPGISERTWDSRFVQPDRETLRPAPLPVTAAVVLMNAALYVVSYAFMARSSRVSCLYVLYA